MSCAKELVIEIILITEIGQKEKKKERRAKIADESSKEGKGGSDSKDASPVTSPGCTPPIPRRKSSLINEVKRSRASCRVPGTPDYLVRSICSDSLLNLLE
jgi:hypothetical protein